MPGFPYSLLDPTLPFSFLSLSSVPVPSLRARSAPAPPVITPTTVSTALAIPKGPASWAPDTGTGARAAGPSHRLPGDDHNSYTHEHTHNSLPSPSPSEEENAVFAGGRFPTFPTSDSRTSTRPGRNNNNRRYRDRDRAHDPFEAPLDYTNDRIPHEDPWLPAHAGQSRHHEVQSGLPSLYQSQNQPHHQEQPYLRDRPRVPGAQFTSQHDGWAFHANPDVATTPRNIPREPFPRPSTPPGDTPWFPTWGAASGSTHTSSRRPATPRGPRWQVSSSPPPAIGSKTDSKSTREKVPARARSGPSSRPRSPSPVLSTPSRARDRTASPDPAPYPKTAPVALPLSPARTLSRTRLGKLRQRFADPLEVPRASAPPKRIIAGDEKENAKPKPATKAKAKAQNKDSISDTRTDNTADPSGRRSQRVKNAAITSARRAARELEKKKEKEEEDMWAALAKLKPKPTSSKPPTQTTAGEKSKKRARAPVYTSDEEDETARPVPLSLIKPTPTAGKPPTEAKTKAKSKKRAPVYPSDGDNENDAPVPLACDDLDDTNDPSFQPVAEFLDSDSDGCCASGKKRKSSGDGGKKKSGARVAGDAGSAPVHALSHAVKRPRLSSSSSTRKRSGVSFSLLPSTEILEAPSSPALCTPPCGTASLAPVFGAALAVIKNRQRNLAAPRRAERALHWCRGDGHEQNRGELCVAVFNVEDDGTIVPFMWGQQSMCHYCEEWYVAG